jgi:integrase
METTRLTQRSVEAARPKATRYTVYDDALKGFGLRVYPSGVKTWIVEYRPAGSGRDASKRRVTLGSTEALAAMKARKAAGDLLAAVRLGADPARERQQSRKALTFEALAQAFLSEHVATKRKPRTLQQYRALLEDMAVPTLGKLKAAEVHRAHVAKLHLKFRATPYQANWMLAVIGAMYSFAQRHGLVPEDVNPARRIEKYREHRRERYLSADEMDRLGSAIREAETVGIPWEVDDTKPTAKHQPAKELQRTILAPHAAAALRMLMLTGARLREILHLRWEHVDFERSMLHIPDSKTGRKSILLTPYALAVIAALPRSSAYVIAGFDPEKPRADLHKPWKLILKRAQIDAVRIHDLRHTFSSIGAGSGMGLPIIGKLLGHTQASTTQRCAQLDNDPLRRATGAIGATIAAAMGEGPAPADVVPFGSYQA